MSSDYVGAALTRAGIRPRWEMDGDAEEREAKEVAQQNEKAKLIAGARSLSYYDEFDKVVQLDWIVKGILAKGHTSYLFGPPGGGKSALYSSAAVHLGAGRDWHGFKIREKYATLCFAMERADLVKKRIWAQCQRDGLDGVPIAIAAGIVSLMDPQCVQAIIGTTLAAEDKLGIEVGFISIDTFGKGIAAGGGDENSAKDQNRAWGNLRLVHEGLARYHSVHVGAIGHTGKDESRGPRGSNAADGDNDVSLQIRNGDSIKDVAIYKANELPEGPLMRFKMAPFDTGLKDEDGDPVEVWIDAHEIIDAASSSPAEPRLTKNQETMFSILREAGQAGLSTEEWNERTKAVGLGVKRPADLYDVRTSLKSKNLARQFSDRWTAAI